MEISKKEIRRITGICGLIVVLSNFCGVALPNIINGFNILQNEDDWHKFMEDYKILTDIAQYFTFILPTVLCIWYGHSKNNIESKIINYPIAFSTIGISGWALYGIEELIFLLFAVKLGYNINLKQVIFSSYVNILTEATVTFTLAYFITETLNRKYVLPKYFSQGHISKIKNARPASIRFLFFVNYISVTLFPVIFLVSFLYNFSVKTGETIGTRSVVLLLVVLIIGLIISFSFSNMMDQPLKSLKRRVKMIEEGNYTSKEYISTNDSFGELSDIINDMNDSIVEKNQKILEIQNSIITGMATMVESRDNSTGGHIMRTSDCVRVFVEKLKDVPEYANISPSFYDAVIKAAPMHDLGKIAVDDAILRKPGKFTDEEYEKMKIHPAEGAKIVEKVLGSVEDKEFKQITVNVAHYHHEKWNGQGYPNKISGEEIPLEARIMALADVFDALVSKRCYKDSFTYDKAFEIIQDSLGTHFDPKLGAEFIKCRCELESLYSSYN